MKGSRRLNKPLSLNVKSVSKVLGQMWALLALRGVPGLLRQTLALYITFVLLLSILNIVSAEYAPITRVTDSKCTYCGVVCAIRCKWKID